MVRSLMPSQRQIDYVRAQAATLQTSTITITRPTKPAFDASTGLISGTANPTLIYSGQAHIYVVTGVIQQIGDEMLSINQTMCSIPWTAPAPWVDDRVKIQTTDDPHLVGKTYRVRDVPDGGLAQIVRTLVLSGVDADAFYNG